MTECKHGMKSGCAYCHTPARPAGSPRPAAVTPPGSKRQSRSARLSEQMNDRMTALRRRLKEIRGQ